ncbi:hypothetical protein [Okeania sp.]|uniref:hypothetical protein n=1 Tax=Okeania sp. TaxID=3100323 RepID=UPI002B4B2121|nr:hypothetical protein [Okeania sp.]MEB3343183.1 hypothetical protein [Okeania sp.]
MDELKSLVLETTLWIMFLKPYIAFLRHPFSINLIVDLSRKINWYLKTNNMLAFINIKQRRYQTAKI